MSAIGVIAALVILLVGKIILTLLGKETEGRIDWFCVRVLRLARRRLPREMRDETYDDEWLPELTFILENEEPRPLTRLVKGVRFSLGLFFGAREIALAGGVHPVRWRPVANFGERVGMTGARLWVSFCALMAGYAAVGLGLLLQLVGAVLEEAGWAVGPELVDVGVAVFGSGMAWAFLASRPAGAWLDHRERVVHRRRSTAQMSASE